MLYCQRLLGTVSGAKPVLALYDLLTSVCYMRARMGNYQKAEIHAHFDNWYRE